jgi:hypothetical protein
MAAVAAQGFRELTRAMMEAAAAKSDPLDRLKCAGLGYVTFALRRPEHFTVMFDAPLAKRKHPDSAAAGEQAFATLVGFVKSCQDAGRLQSGDLHHMALLAWTMVHGIAKLAITGRLSFRSNTEVLKFVEFVIEQSRRLESTEFSPYWIFRRKSASSPDGCLRTLRLTKRAAVSVVLNADHPPLE